MTWSPLWSSGQSFWLQIQMAGFYSWHYQIFSEEVSGKGSTQPREYNWGATWKKKYLLLPGRPRIRLTTWHPLSANLALTSPISSGRVRSRTQATEFRILMIYKYIHIRYNKISIIIFKVLRFKFIISMIFGFLDFVHRLEFQISRKHNVAATWWFCVFSWKEEGLLDLSEGPNRRNISLPSPEERKKKCGFWNLFVSL
jgi:hypothetical protein